jgi:hypothetical protein
VHQAVGYRRGPVQLDPPAEQPAVELAERVEVAVRDLDADQVERPIWSPPMLMELLHR